MPIIPVPAFTDNYIWAIVDKNQGVFDCIDPGDAQPVLDFAQTQKLKLRTILLTHHHHDHVGGVDELLKQNPTCIAYGPYDTRIASITHPVKEHQYIKIGKFSFQILFNPGHTASHISYYESEQGWLFCGDTLFSAGCGRVFDGTLEQLHQSINLFKSLPPTTKVFCAHEYTKQNLRFALSVEPNNLIIQQHLNSIKEHPNHCTLPSTIEHEFQINPFFRTEVPEVQHFACKHGATSNASLEIFRILREEKNKFK